MHIDTPKTRTVTFVKHGYVLYDIFVCLNTFVDQLWLQLCDCNYYVCFDVKMYLNVHFYDCIPFMYNTIKSLITPETSPWFSKTFTAFLYSDKKKIILVLVFPFHFFFISRRCKVALFHRDILIENHALWQTAEFQSMPWNSSYFLQIDSNFSHFFSLITGLYTIRWLTGNVYAANQFLVT